MAEKEILHPSLESCAILRTVLLANDVALAGTLVTPAQDAKTL